MFLPVLLVRDHGLWGFVVFAVPNVVGAAAMGWVLRSPAASRAMVEKHRPAMQAFSLVTIIFQLFFLLSLIQPSVVRAFAPVAPYAPLLGAVGLFVLTLLFNFLTRRRGLGIMVWLGSMALLLAAAFVGGGVLRVPALTFGAPSGDVLALAPVCAFGFLLCPYLDLTFHRARQSLAGAQGGRAFTLGFGVLFLAMILATLGYSGAALYSMDVGQPLPTWGPTLIAAHIVLQILFTCAVHLEELLAEKAGRPSWGLTLGALVLVIGAAIGLALDRPDVRYSGLSFWEITYRCFMSFYGLVFPAYVWLCVIPTRSGKSPMMTHPTRSLITLGVVVLAAAPMYWLGFIERQTLWLLPAIGLILLARLAIMSGSGPRAGESG